MADSSGTVGDNGAIVSSVENAAAVTPMDVDGGDLIKPKKKMLNKIRKLSPEQSVESLGIATDSTFFGEDEAADVPGKSPTASQRRMKKDDSGISVEKGPSEDGSFDEEESDMVTSGKGKGLSKLDVNLAAGVVDKSSPDSGHHERSYGPDYLDTREDEETENNTRKPKSPDTSTKEELPMVGGDNALLDSDDEISSTISDVEVTIEPKKKQRESYSEDEDFLIKRFPSHKWFICQEVIDRQIGVASKYQSDLFRYRAHGSLHGVERLELMYKMKQHDGCVNTLHFNSSGTRLASGSDDLSVAVWDWTINKTVLVYDSGHRSNVFQAKFIPFSGDCHIVSCARDGQVRLAELSTTGICKGTRRLAQHRSPAHKLALQYDAPHTFLSCGEDAVVYEVDLRVHKPEKLLMCKENDRKVALYSIFSNPSNVYEFAVGGRDHFVRIYDKRNISESDTQVKKFCPHKLLDSETQANVTCLVYNYNGSEILATYNDEDIYAFDSRHSDGADFVHRYRGHRNSATVKGVNYFGPKSQFIVSGSDCGNIFLWEHDSEHVVNFMAGDEGGVVNCLEPHPQMPVLASSGLDDDVKIWMPSCEQGPKLSGLKSIMRANRKDRDDERQREPDTIDGQMLWFLMHHLRRSARHRARMDGQEVVESSSSDRSEESDDSEEMPEGMQCAPS